MIGNIVERILAAGFDLSVHQHEHMLVLRMAARMGKDSYYTVDWVVDRDDLVCVSDDCLLLNECDERLQRLREEIAKKYAHGVVRREVDMGQRAQIGAQLQELQQKAVLQPLPGDGAGMIGFAATLLAAQMQVLVLQNDLETAQEVPRDETAH